MRQLPLRPRHDLNGATFVVHAGWEVPASYSNLDDEVAAVRSAAGIMDMSDRVKVRVTGNDRVSFLNGLVTKDLATLRDPRADEAGWVMDHIRKHLISDDVILEEFPAAHISLHGPLAPTFVRRLVGDAAVPQGPGGFPAGPVAQQ